MRHLGIVASSVVPASAPSVTISSTTNFNQDRATLNGVVSANGAITTSIKFQVSPNSGTNWYDAIGGTTITNTSSNDISVYYNATGWYNSDASLNQYFSSGTTYSIRLVATNAIGTTTSSTTSFTTWALKTYQTATVGTTSLSIPTITPTGGSAIVPSILNAFVVGGGAGGYGYGSGGGGGVASVSSQSFNNTSSLLLTITVGDGGYGGEYGGNDGQASSITGSSFTSITGAAGLNTGVSGNGYGRGNSAEFSGSTGGQTPTSVYLYATGGGGGSAGTGGNAAVGNVDNQYAYGGTGGNSTYSSTYSVYGGAGGGGAAREDTVMGTAARGGPPTGGYGIGGAGIVMNDGNITSYATSGTSGYVAFQYYGPP